MNIESPEPRPSSALGVNLAGVDLNLLVSLHALLEERSVTAAADRVGLSQPAMSHALRRIRKLFGDEILVRRGGGSLLTPKARELLVPLRDLLQRASGIIRGEEFRPEFSRRTVTIAMSSSISYILGGAITRLLEEEAPWMGLRILATDDISDTVFTERGADVLLLAQGWESPHPRQRLFDDDWVVIGGTPELLEGDVISRLQDWPHVVLDSGRVSRPYEELRHRGVNVRVQVRVNDYLLLPQFVAGVRRIGLHRRRVIEQLARTYPLYLAEFPFPVLGLGVDMVWNPWLGDKDFQGWLDDLLRRASEMQQMNVED